MILPRFDFELNPLNVFAGAFSLHFGRHARATPSVKAPPTDSLVLHTAHEVAGMIDSSFTTKMTVQYNLFAGTVLKLGSDRHRKYLQGVDDMSVIGCFALTELGYGNNAVEMETTAVWDPRTKEFVINSPSVLSRKWYWYTQASNALTRTF